MIRSLRLPPAWTTSTMLLSTCRTWAAKSVGISFVVGSSGPWPEVKTKSPNLMAWDSGGSVPSAKRTNGALSVWMRSSTRSC